MSVKSRAVAVGLLLLSVAGCSGPRRAATRPAQEMVSGGDLVSDFKLLRRVYEELHPGLYRYTTPTQLDERFARLVGAVERGATLREAYLALSRFLATVRCGHSYANFFNQPEPIARALFKTGATRVPFLFAWRDRRMIVTSDHSEGAQVPRGTEILAIDGVEARAILLGLLETARADGSNDRKRIDLLELHGDTDLETFDVFFPLVFPPRAEGRFELRVRSPAGEERTLSVAALTYEQRAALARARPGAQRDGASPIWTLEAAGEGAAWLRMPSWALYNAKWDWKAFLAEAFASLQAKGTRDLIVDLRQNEGGLGVGDVLLSHLVTRDLRLEPVERRVRYRKVPATLSPILDTWDPSFKDWGDSAVGPEGGFYRLSVPDDDGRGKVIRPTAPRFGGRVFVVVDASNSSATFDFARTVLVQGLGTLVGTPTGGNQRGINGGAFFFVRLPRTGLEVDLPLTGQFPQGEQPDKGLEPEVLVEATAADIAAGRDPVRAAIDRLRAGGAGGPAAARSRRARPGRAGPALRH
ncbi:MAG: S41 family peptidase [Myxococcales bacterium]